MTCGPRAETYIKKAFFAITVLIQRIKNISEVRFICLIFYALVEEENVFAVVIKLNVCLIFTKQYFS